jgi:RNA polymerase primary sigma factor
MSSAEHTREVPPLIKNESSDSILGVTETIDANESRYGVEPEEEISDSLIEQGISKVILTDSSLIEIAQKRRLDSQDRTYLSICIEAGVFAEQVLQINQAFTKGKLNDIREALTESRFQSIRPKGGGRVKNLSEEEETTWRATAVEDTSEVISAALTYREGPANTNEDLHAVTQIGEQAKHLMIIKNLGLVRKVALGYRDDDHRSDEYEEIFNTGVLGLIHSIEKFDYKRDTQFSTYAMYWIRSYIQRELQNNSRSIRIPVNQLEKRGKLDQVTGELAQEQLRTPTAIEIAEKLGNNTTEAEVLELQSLFKIEPTSLDRLSLDEDSADSFHELIPDRSSPSVEELAMRTTVETTTIITQAALATLPENIRQVLLLSFGFTSEDGNPMTLQEIANTSGKDRNSVAKRLKLGIAMLQSLASVPITNANVLPAQRTKRQELLMYTKQNKAIGRKLRDL